jgi:hypothetical protein
MYLISIYLFSDKESLSVDINVEMSFSITYLRNYRKFTFIFFFKFFLLQKIIQYMQGIIDRHFKIVYGNFLLKTGVIL